MASSKANRARQHNHARRHAMLEAIRSCAGCRILMAGLCKGGDVETCMQYDRKR